MHDIIHESLSRQEKAFCLLRDLLEEEYSSLLSRDTDAVVSLEFSVQELIRHLAVEKTFVIKRLGGMRAAEYASMLPEDMTAMLLETLRHTPCEVVLLDISMPGVNGLEAIPRIRALTHPPAVLVLSMHDEAQMAARALKIGAAGYATKDSDPAFVVLGKTEIEKVKRASKAAANGVHSSVGVPYWHDRAVS